MYSDSLGFAAAASLVQVGGHQGTITAVAFSPQQQHQLVTAAEDRTFKVWDLHEGQLLYQSSILGCAVPTCLALDAMATRLAVGCSDGSLRQFDMSQLPACRELQVVNISRAMQQVASAVIIAATAAELSQPSDPKTITLAASAGTQAAYVQALCQQLQHLTSVPAETQSSTNIVGGMSVCSSYPELSNVQAEGSGCILGMQVVQHSPLDLESDHDAVEPASASRRYSLHSQQLVQELLMPPQQLLVCTRRGIALVNTGSGEVQNCYIFGWQAARVQEILQQARGLASNRTASMGQPSTPVSQLQQPSVQQQQAKVLATFRTLACIEPPAAACCFAAECGQQRWRDPSTAWCCIAPCGSSSLSILQLGPKELRTQECSSACTSSSSFGASSQACSKLQLLSVFQSGVLPVDSPMLRRTLRHTSSSGSSCSSGSGTAMASARNGSRVAPAVDAARVQDNAPPLANDGSARRRATWSADGASTPASSLAAGAAAGKLGSPSNKPSHGKGAVAIGAQPLPKKSLPADRAVTFHKHIKSSGYGFVQPKVKLGQTKPAPVKVGASSGVTAAQLLAKQLAVHQQYPIDAAPPSAWELQQVEQLPGGPTVHNGGVLRVAFPGDGCRLLTASRDKTARCLWLPVSKHGGAGTTFVGHSGPVTCIDWSHDGEYLLTASSDRTANLWACSNASPQISFSSLHRHASSSASSSCRSNQLRSMQRSSSSSSSSIGKSLEARMGPNMRPPHRSCSTHACSPLHGASIAGQQQDFLFEVTAARFFYMDQFVLLTTGNRLHLYRYKLPDTPAHDDIQRLKAIGSYSVSGSYNSSCQTIFDLAAVNSFASTLVLLACSNRSIELIDAATLQVARTIADAHGRPAQRLVQPPASQFISHPRQVYELFASAAPDGLVKLWDVRSGSCVRNFTGHKHSSTQVPIGLAFSPCMSYLATGSEDKAAYVYDLRTCTLLAKVRPPGPQTDVIADVAFHPVKPQLVLGCMNGSLYWCGDVGQQVQSVFTRGGGMITEYVNNKEEMVL